tara:strand:+ start:1601 stop:2602 length:1002 start_codon:yes stop_codon:yes gene_type:complete
MAYIDVANNNGLGAAYSGANFNEIFLQPIFTDDDIMSNFRVIPNVRYRMNLYNADELSCIVQSYDTCDDTDYVGKDFNVNTKSLIAGRMRVALEQCQAEFFGTYIEESYRAGLDVFNLTGTDLMNTIMTNVRRGIVQDITKLAWFGDTTDSSECYNSTDGLLKYMLAGVTPVAWTTGAITTDTALDQLREVMEGGSAALNAMNNNEKCIWVTPNLYWNYIASVEGGNAGVAGDAAHKELVDGRQIYFFRGVELKPMFSWVSAIATASTWSNDQIMVYAAKKNFVLGTDTNDPSNELKFWYDEYREKMIIRSYFKFGTQYVHDSLISWSHRNSS